MDLNHQKWPNSWDYHISQYCNFYFCDKDIKYLDQKFWTEATTQCPDAKVTTMNLGFQIGEHKYMVGIHRGDGTHFSCSIYYKKLHINSNDPTALHVSCAGGADVFLLDDVAGIGGHDMTASEIMEFAEQMMWEDYNRRSGNDWDNDDDNGENDPVEPFSPTEIVEPELILV